MAESGGLVPESDLEDLVARTGGAQPWRRLFHAGLGVAFAGALWTLRPPRPTATGFLAALAAILLVLDLARLAVPRLNLIFFRVFRSLASPREANRIASSTWYVVGVATCLLLFEIEVVVPSILVLALADPAASFLGRRWGRHPLGTGSVEGLAIFVLTGVVVLLPLVPAHSAVPAALAGAVAEVVPWKLDDNLVIPLTVASVLWLTGAG